MKRLITTVMLACAPALAGCATAPESKDYTAYYAQKPRSILVVPVINHSNEVDAADLFLATMAAPLAERGYYAFPTNATKALMQAEGLGDPGFVHQAQPQDLARLFGADAILYVEVLDWDSKYKVVSATIETEFLYTLKSGRTGEVLWQDQERYVYSPQSSTGNIFADLLATAVTSLINNTKSDFTPMAMQANMAALSAPGQGLPFGSRNSLSDQNAKLFPATGTGRLTDAEQEAVAAPGLTALHDAVDEH
ncbi:DUF799 domain-containing protein [Novosphingobium pentaromativorans]|uniref:Lipoprotein, putative n=1 Tax=Novosphingobium pentaromativorans US6-1 TaxID=1088721 RepID=G6EKL3_9SPHN|nr:GNA1162 family protein [Novosphingobium pentaromativorans]AIT82805.1 hypothetical protein JI59_25540 [Novosphingobium pentaromativorans US6-1]EHJ58169.1 lipoprotein, putative [Novosphingobium pentaromativorans US6-1]